MGLWVFGRFLGILNSGSNMLTVGLVGDNDVVAASSLCWRTVSGFIAYEIDNNFPGTKSCWKNTSNIENKW